jgi:hypothetical protein
LLNSRKYTYFTVYCLQKGERVREREGGALVDVSAEEGRLETGPKEDDSKKEGPSIAVFSLQGDSKQSGKFHSKWKYSFFISAVRTDAHDFGCFCVQFK